MFQLFLVVEHGRVVSRGLEIGSLRQLETREEVHEHEGCELGAVLVCSEHVLVVYEVRTEEQNQGFEVHDLRVVNVTNDPRFLVGVHLFR